MSPSEKHESEASRGRLTTERVEALLRQYARLLPLERLLSEPRAAALRKRIGPSRGDSAASRARGSAAQATGIPAAPRFLHSATIRTLGALAAAVLIAVMLATPAGHQRPAALALAADVARDRGALFSTLRDSAGHRPDAPLYIGVRLQQPAFIRIIGVDEHGRAESFSLDEAGREELRIAEHARAHVFGGYPTGAIPGEAGEVRVVLVFASPRPVEPARLSALLTRATAQSRGQNAEAVARRVAAALRTNLGCSVRSFTL